MGYTNKTKAELINELMRLRKKNSKPREKQKLLMENEADLTKIGDSILDQLRQSLTKQSTPTPPTELTPESLEKFVLDRKCTWGEAIKYYFSGRSISSPIQSSNDDLDSFVVKLSQICGKQISVYEPIVDGKRTNILIVGNSQAGQTYNKLHIEYIGVVL
jgi:hypothetical protein